jgi:SAM-dependent methyltransferase
MSHKDKVLTYSAAKDYYDHFGKKQDSQGFYEDPAQDDLVRNADFGQAQHVFEFGCGTGKFAARLFEKSLSPSASYIGNDISPVMVGLAKERLKPYGDRAQVVLSEGRVKFPLEDRSVDRVVSTYVLDLLSEEDAHQFFAEAHRTLVPGGKLCLAGLTRGIGIPSRIVSTLWSAVFRIKPAIVGGCRPIRLETFVDPLNWQMVYEHVVAPFGVPSEILVLLKK